MLELQKEAYLLLKARESFSKGAGLKGEVKDPSLLPQQTDKMYFTAHNVTTKKEGAHHQTQSLSWTNWLFGLKFCSSLQTVAYLLMWAKPSSTDLMAFLLRESLGLQEEMEGVGEFFGQRIWTKRRRVHIPALTKSRKPGF